MNLILKFALQKKKNHKLDKGFITLEIIIALLIAFGFLMVSLQTIVLGRVMQVGATKEQRADKIIQLEIERLNDLGSRLASSQAACNGDLNGDGTFGDGYGDSLWADRRGIAFGENGFIITDPNRYSYSTETLLGSSVIVEADRATIAPGTTPTPHRILGITFQVAVDDDDDGVSDTNEIIANRYVEVIPDVALECS